MTHPAEVGHHSGSLRQTASGISMVTLDRTVMREDSGMHNPDPDSEIRRRGRLGRFVDSYFRTTGSPDLDDIRASLWTEAAERGWAAYDPTYRAAVLDQYKIYVEMADRISARRGLANTFFLTLNTAVVTVIGIFLQHPAHEARALAIVPWMVLVGQCLAWFWIIRAYRQLNSAKYAVVGAMEERLPASPYWSAEWTALGEGREPARYLPITHVESWIPALFAVAYTVGLILVFAL
jgi:hypothetical protein